MEKEQKQRQGEPRVRSKSDRVYLALVSLLSVFLIITLVNAFFITNINATLKSKESLIKEQTRAAVLQVTEITASCTTCFDISAAVSSIGSKNVNITSTQKLSADSQEAKDLIKKYNIQRLPTVIITGEINRTKLTGFLESSDALIFTDVKLPYVETSSGKIIGNVEVIKLVDSSCKECSDIQSIVSVFEQLGVKVTAERSVEYNSAEGKDLAKKFNVQKLPAVIVSKDIALYDSLKDVWTQLNTTERDGQYALHTLQAPYREVSTGLVIGLVDLTFLVDKTCPLCYNVSAHEPIINRLGVYIQNKKIVDISSTEGKSLISKYAIDKAPTIILSSNAKEYADFVAAWEQVGTVESDGKYVFRAVELMGTYQDIKNNKTVSQ